MLLNSFYEKSLTQINSKMSKQQKCSYRSNSMMNMDADSLDKFSSSTTDKNINCQDQVDPREVEYGIQKYVHKWHNSVSHNYKE